MDNQNKGRGRPSTLTPEEREQRRIERNRKLNEYHKSTGYASRKKHYAEHGYPYYEPKVRIPKEAKELVFELQRKHHKKSLTHLFLDALEHQYGIKIVRDDIDNSDE